MSNTGTLNDNNKNQATERDDFMIRTMETDLLLMQKGLQPKNSPSDSDTAQTTGPWSATTSEKNLSINSPATPSPFSVSATTPDAAPTSPPQSAKTIDSSEPPKQSSASKKTYKVLLAAIFLLFVAIAGLGGYYYFFLVRNKAIVETPTESPVETPAETPVIIQPVTEKYSPTMPNYLSFDPATENLSVLITRLLGIADELKSKNPGSLYEFTFVDSNNNPVFLPIFSAATKFNLSPTLLENLKENFSLYFYNDAGNMRIAIVAAIKDKSIVTSEMLKKENSFASDAAFLFLENITTKKTEPFKNGFYNGTTVRYLNLTNNQPSLSIDYAITESNLVIGTSQKNTRALLEKLSTVNSQGGEQSVQNIQTYTNTLGGFMLSYPGNWTQYDNSDGPIFIEKPATPKMLLDSSLKKNTCFVSISIMENIANIEPETACKDTVGAETFGQNIYTKCSMTSLGDEQPNFLFMIKNSFKKSNNLLSIDYNRETRCQTAVESFLTSLSFK